MVIVNPLMDVALIEWENIKNTCKNDILKYETNNKSIDVYIRIRYFNTNFIVILNRFEGKYINIHLVKGLDVTVLLQGCFINEESIANINIYLKKLSYGGYVSDEVLFQKKNILISY